MRNFYITFDFQEENIDIALAAHAPEGTEMVVKNWAEIAEIGGGSALVLGAIAGVYNRVSRSKKPSD